METTLKKWINPLINRLGKTKEENHFSRPPVILGGCARSGTTLLLAVLSAHPSFFTIPKEIRLFSRWKPNPEGDQPPLIPCRMDRLYRYLLVRSIPDSATRWLEKDTINIRYFQQILDYYQGEVRLVHIIRDGRDVMTSYHPKRPDAFWVEPDRWVFDMQEGLKYADHPLVYTLKYEDLVLRYEETVKKLLEFLGEDFHPHLREWHLHTPIQRSQGWFGGVQRTHARSIGKWKQDRYQERVREIMAHPEARKMLETLGYL
ncbi:MAG: sulfotransferase [Candidatus Neomarinimicrobiota bacterium]|nr:MAG: sulfotransferase [Candidatus Neomarinimicrobiota bacterium]